MSRPTLLVPALVSGQKPAVPTPGLFWKIRLMDDCTFMVMVSWPELDCARPATPGRHNRPRTRARNALFPSKWKLRLIAAAGPGTRIHGLDLASPQNARIASRGTDVA